MSSLGRWRSAARYAMVGLVGGAMASALADPLDDLRARMAFWRAEAFVCPAATPAFPSSETGEPAQPCNDGDMTLFNGLLCHAGEQRGCDAVRNAQDPSTGEWHRSPRIRALGRNDRGDANFSPDMALGVQLYALRTRDVDRFYKWLLWMHDNVACSVEIAGICVLRALPRFCTNDAPNAGCTLRPGDAALLALTVDRLQRDAGMKALPDGRLRGHLGSFGSLRNVIVEFDSLLNKPGYSQHILAVGLMVARATGAKDAGIDGALARLAGKPENQGNAFFTYLNGQRIQAIAETLQRCPGPSNPSARPVNEWQWERDTQAQAWKRSNYWDCIFMGRLLGVE